MPLDEIADVVGTDDLEARNQVITSHLDRLERVLSTTQTAVRSLRDLLGSSTLRRSSCAALPRPPSGAPRRA